MKTKLYLALVGVLLVAAGAVTFRYYEFLFSSKIRGEVLKVERVNSAQTIISNGQQVPAAQLFSFAVAIKDEKGEIHTASSEDRQWAVVQSGQCAEATFFPYPPWQLEKNGTYHGARLERLYECKSQAATQGP